MRYQTINPATEEIIESYSLMPLEEVRAQLAQTEQAFGAWRQRCVTERAALLTALATVLRENRARYARTITIEMGKPIREARAEVEKCAWLCEVYAEHGPAWLAEQRVHADGLRHRVVLQPLGVILSVMPWNFPFWQVLRCAVPALLAGNASLLKHARNVPQCALAIEAAFREAGFPEELFRTVLTDHEGVAALLASDAVRGVSLTGSTAAGMRVAAAAGRELKKVVLELGGSDPFIVLEDADLDVTVPQAVTGRMLNTGQSCIAAKRFLVAAPIADEFIERFTAEMKSLVIGDPLDEQTRVGPLVNREALETLQAQLAASVEQGARVTVGGKRLDRPGYFFEPTVAADVTPKMPIAREEVFGPVAPVLVVRDEREALALANATPFGLGGSVWTRDLERGTRIAYEIEAGAVFVNSIVKSDPRLPFGGIKQSGLGRELAAEGLHEFVNVKSLNVYRHGG